MLLKILLENGFDESQAENFIKYYIKRGRKSLSESCQCRVNGDRCMFCFIGSLKGPYSHQYYLNKNNGLLTESTQTEVQAIIDKWAAVALDEKIMRE